MNRIALLALLILPLAAAALERPATRIDPAAPYDFEGYTTELSHWSARVSRLREHQQEAGQLRAELPQQWTVDLNHQHFVVSTRWLSIELAQVSADPQSAARLAPEMNARLGSMLAEAQEFQSMDASNPVAARARLDEILRRREFSSVRAPDDAATLWDQLTNRLWKFIFKLLDRAGEHPAVARGLLWGVVILLGLAFLGWLVYALSNVSMAGLLARHPPAPAEAAVAGTWREWIEHARTVAARGEYREAIRILYGAALRRIAETGTWQVDPARTHREYVRLVRADSVQRSPLVAITNCFERVWYGHAPASAVDYEAVLAELELLR